jgi:hypothetical protein
MRRELLVAVVLGLSYACAPPGAWADEKRTSLETARWAAGLNAKSEAGREWVARNVDAIGKRLTPVLNGCLPESGDEVTAFSVFVRLSREGRVLEVLTDLDDSLGACLTTGGRELRLPEPPRNDYWVQVNLAASL